MLLYCVVVEILTGERDKCFSLKITSYYHREYTEGQWDLQQYFLLLAAEDRCCLLTAELHEASA